MYNLSTAEKSRLALFKMAKGNPQVIMVALDEIKAQAKEALHTTLSTAEPSVLKELDKKVDDVFAKYVMRVNKLLKTLSDEYIANLDKVLSDKVSKIVIPKGDKGEKGDRPTEQEIRDLIVLLMPAPIPGRPPTKEEVMEVAKPILMEMVTNLLNKTPDQMAEESKALKDLIYGVAIDVIGQKISEIKKFSGGGASTGGGSVNVSTLSGTIDGSNTSFIYRGLATLRFIVADGVTYFEGNGYSKSGTAITMDIPPSQYIKAIT